MGAQDAVLSIGLKVTQLAAAVAPVPGLQPAVELLVSIVQLCQNVSANRWVSEFSCLSVFLTFLEISSFISVIDVFPCCKH